MKVLGKTMDVICKIMTKYFLIWCPKEAVGKFTNTKCCDKKQAEYEEYYTGATRWV